MNITPFDKEIAVSLALARKAAYATELIRDNGIQAISKNDGSPLTQADIVSQAIILSGLQRHFPGDRIIAEEELPARGKDDIYEAASAVLRELGISDAESSLKSWVNFRGNPHGSRTWMIDPIDGTKGYKRGLCYAIAMGLYFDGKPQFGCLASPSFPDANEAGHKSVIAYAGTKMGAFFVESGNERPQRIHVSDFGMNSELRIVGSRAHDAKDICDSLVKRIGKGKFMPIDSQAKYLMVASGQAEVYVRGADPVYGIGFQWDHCAGQAILEQAGGAVTDLYGHPLYYNPGSVNPMTDLDGLVATNGRCHEAILGLVKDIT